MTLREWRVPKIKGVAAHRKWIAMECIVYCLRIYISDLLGQRR